jgi:cytidine deaminase
MATARDDVKKFIEKIDIAKSMSSFRITCLEEAKEQKIDDFRGVEVSVEISQHKESKHSTIDFVTLFSNTNYKKILHEFMMCRDMMTEFDMPEIHKFKVTDETDYSKCEIKASLHSYKFVLTNKQD